MTGPHERSTVFVARLSAAARWRNTWLGLTFAGIGGAGFEAVGAVVGPFLVDRQVGEQDIAMFFSLISVPCMIAGAVAGGLLADRLGKRRAAAGFLILMVVAVGGCRWHRRRAALGGHGSLLGVRACFYVSIGLFTTASSALFMELTDPSIAPTQFSAFMAFTNLCESWSAFTVGRLVPTFGHPGAFVTMAAISVAALAAVCLMRVTPSRPVGSEVAGLDDILT